MSPWKLRKRWIQNKRKRRRILGRSRLTSLRPLMMICSILGRWWKESKIRGRSLKREIGRISSPYWNSSPHNWSLLKPIPKISSSPNTKAIIIAGEESWNRIMMITTYWFQWLRYQEWWTIFCWSLGHNHSSRQYSIMTFSLEKCRRIYQSSTQKRGWKSWRSY